MAARFVWLLHCVPNHLLQLDAASACTLSPCYSGTVYILVMWSPYRTVMLYSLIPCGLIRTSIVIMGGFLKARVHVAAGCAGAPSPHVCRCDVSASKFTCRGSCTNQRWQLLLSPVEGSFVPQCWIRLGRVKRELRLLSQHTWHYRCWQGTL